MEKQPEFKKNLWGYDKEAVLKYIDEMSRTAAQSEAALQERSARLPIPEKNWKVRSRNLSRSFSIFRVYWIPKKEKTKA